MKHSQKLWGGTLVVLLMIGAVGCELFDRRTPSEPTSPGSEAPEHVNATYGHEDGKLAPYQPGRTPGIEIVADFTTYHLEGQPYGTWVVHATWRNEDRQTIADVTVAFTIDGTGIGRAQLPASFLDLVFADAASRWQTSEDQSTWFHRPGLYLGVFADDETYQYYQFNGRLSNWSFGGCLAELVEQLGLDWWPDLTPLTNVAVSVDIGDPISLQIQAINACEAGGPLTYAGSTHTVAECTAAGGTCYDTGAAGTMCRFVGSLAAGLAFCPATWASAGNWNRQITNAEFNLLLGPGMVICPGSLELLLPSTFTNQFPQWLALTGAPTVPPPTVTCTNWQAGCPAGTNLAWDLGGGNILCMPTAYLPAPGYPGGNEMEIGCR
jgi:hypothetical protein